MAFFSRLICTVVMTQTCLLILFSGTSLSQEYREATAEKPLWEIVLFNTAAHIPHYPGSDEAEWYLLPLPYLIYRGDFLRVDREGVRGIFHQSEYFETDISLFGNPPVEDDNEARQGMEDLDPLFEIGPQLKWFFTGRDPLDELYIRLALRGVFSIGFDEGLDMEYQGLHGGVNLIYKNGNMFREQGLRYGFNLGVNYANAKINDYFYEVKPEDVLPNRRLYDPEGGYAGFSLGAHLTAQLSPTLRWGIYGRLDNIDGAVFAESPLVRQKNTFFFGTVLTWRLYSSKKMVKVTAEGE